MRCAVEGAGAVHRQTRAWTLAILTAGKAPQHFLSPVVVFWVLGELEHRAISSSVWIERAASNCRAIERAARVHDQPGTGASAILNIFGKVGVEAIQHLF